MILLMKILTVLTIKLSFWLLTTLHKRFLRMPNTSIRYQQTEEFPSGNLIDNLTAYSLDNDTMGVMVVATDNLSSENGTRGQLLVSLRSQPYDNVTLDFMADNGTWTF